MRQLFCNHFLKRKILSTNVENQVKNSKLHPILFKKAGVCVCESVCVCVCVCIITQLRKEMRGIYTLFLHNVTSGT